MQNVTTADPVSKHHAAASCEARVPMSGGHELERLRWEVSEHELPLALALTIELARRALDAGAWSASVDQLRGVPTPGLVRITLATIRAVELAK